MTKPKLNPGLRPFLKRCTTITRIVLEGPFSEHGLALDQLYADGFRTTQSGPKPLDGHRCSGTTFRIIAERTEQE